MAYTVNSRPKIPRNKYGYVSNGAAGARSFSAGYTNNNTEGGSGGGGIVYTEFGGATPETDGFSGLVPQPAAGQQQYVLKGNGNWEPETEGFTIDEDGNIVFDSSVIFKQYIEANSDASIHGNLTVMNTLITDNIKSEGKGFITVDSNTTFTKDITVNNDINCNGIIKSKQIQNSGDIFTKNINATNEVTTKNLTVTGKAHFFELVVDEVKAAGGQIILSPADFKVDYVRKIAGTNNILARDINADSLDENIFKTYVRSNDISVFTTVTFYQKATDEDGREIKHKFQAGDLVRCQNFNLNETVKDNKEFWKLVLDTSTATISGEKYLSLTIADRYTKNRQIGFFNVGEGSLLEAEEGDDFVCLGNIADPDRQNAIILSSYKNIDNQNVSIGGRNVSIGTPSIVQYNGINDFSLTGKYNTVFSPNGNIIKGDLRVQTGETINQLINNITQNQETYLHFAYCLDEDGYGFTKTAEPGVVYTYLGICTSNMENDDNLAYADYQWTPINNQQVDTSFVKLFVTTEKAYLSVDKELKAYFSYMVYKQDNAGVSSLAQSDDNNGNIWRITVSNDVNNVERTLTNNNYSWIYNESFDYSSSSLSEQITEFTVRLYYNNSIIEQRKVKVQTLAGALFEVTDQIVERVQDNEVNISELIIRADGIDTTVRNQAGDINTLKLTASSATAIISDIQGHLTTLDASVGGLKTTVQDVSNNLSTQISQSSDDIKLWVNSNLSAAGINITNNQITLDAANTIITGNLGLYGLVRRKALHITRSNISQYVEYGIIFEQYCFNEKFWRECGGYIVFDNGCFNDYAGGDNSIFMVMPSLYPGESGGIQAEVARELVGANISLYNKSGKNIVITGYSYYNIADPASPTSFVLSNNYFGNFMCMLSSVNEQETLGWYRQVGRINNNIRFEV